MMNCTTAGAPHKCRVAVHVAAGRTYPHLAVQYRSAAYILVLKLLMLGLIHSDTFILYQLPFKQALFIISFLYRALSLGGIVCRIWKTTFY